MGKDVVTTNTEETESLYIGKGRIAEKLFEKKEGLERKLYTGVTMENRYINQE